MKGEVEGEGEGDGDDDDDRYLFNHFGSMFRPKPFWLKALESTRFFPRLALVVVIVGHRCLQKTYDDDGRWMVGGCVLCCAVGGRAWPCVFARDFVLPLVRLVCRVCLPRQV